MPELPDIEAYLEALRPRLADQALTEIELRSPFLLRTIEPSLDEVQGRTVRALSRLGKRIVISLDADLHMVLHLMVAGRLHWKPPKGRTGGKAAHAVFHFTSGLLVLTEAGTRRRASLHLVRGTDALSALDPGGLELEGACRQEFRAALGRENHTLKRALTDPRLVSGIGGAYGDEILFRARLSPTRTTERLSDEEWARLFDASILVLREWTERLCREARETFPEKVTAFRPEMAVHGKFGQACPVCGAKVQRIAYSGSETNYCPGCQTGGKILADRALSRLLKKDWPRTLEELEEGRRGSA